MLKKITFKNKKSPYQPIPGILGMGDDYHIYKMSIVERLTALVLGVVIGVILGYVFFNSWIFAIIISIIFAIGLQEPYRKYQQNKRMRGLLLQFKDLLETLSASYSAGAALQQPIPRSAKIPSQTHQDI